MRSITYASLMDYVTATINKTFNSHNTYPYKSMTIDLKYLYDKYNISDSQDKKLKSYLVDYLGCKDLGNNIFTVEQGYINIDRNFIGVINIRRNPDIIYDIINISYSVWRNTINGIIPEHTSVIGLPINCYKELHDYGIQIGHHEGYTDIYISNPEEMKFAKYKGGRIMFREVVTVAKENKKVDIINTYDVLKVQQQNIRSTKLVKGLKEIQKSIPNETFREVDVAIMSIDQNIQAKANQILMRYHMTMSKKYRIDNTYTIMCNCLTTNDDISKFKSSVIIHNPDNNIQSDWGYSKMRIDPYDAENDDSTTNHTTIEDELNISEDPTNFIDAFPPVKEMVSIAEENDFDSIPSANSMKDEADAINKDIIELRKEIAYGIRFAAKRGEYEFSTSKVVYGCIISELKSKGYKVRIFDGVTTFSFK